MLEHEALLSLILSSFLSNRGPHESPLNARCWVETTARKIGERAAEKKQNRHEDKKAEARMRCSIYWTWLWEAIGPGVLSDGPSRRRTTTAIIGHDRSANLTVSLSPLKWIFDSRQLITKIVNIVKCSCVWFARASAASAEMGKCGGKSDVAS